MNTFKLLTTLMVGMFYVQLHAQEKHDTINEVLVYGAMQAKDFRSTAPMFSLSKESMDRLGVTDISSALNRLPGITLKDYGGAGGLKTVSVRGFGSQHTTVVYDGIALSNNQSGSIDVSRYSMDNLSDLSLVVGDNDDIFQPVRNVASAASLYINTQKLPNEDKDIHLTAQMKLGSWDQYNPHFRLDKNLSNRLGISIVGDYLHANNDYPYTIYNVTQKVSARRNNSEMKSGHAELSMVYRLSNLNTLSLKAYYYDNSRNLPGMVHYYVNESRQHMHDQNSFAQINWHQAFSTKWQMNYMAKFNYLMTDYKDPAYPHGVKDHQYWQREYYTSACLLYKHSDKLIFDYSLDLAHNNLTGGDVSTYRSPRRNTILQSLVAKYRTARFTIVGRIIESIYYDTVTSGESAKNINHLSPSLSVNYKLIDNEDLYLRFSYKDIFRAPSFNESYYEHYGSTDLNPERTNQVNIGVTWNKHYKTASLFCITMDAYVNEVKDKIMAIPYDMFKWTCVNLGKVHTQGIDLTTNLQHSLSASHQIILYGNYTFQRVVDKTGGKGSQYYNYQVAYTPKHSGGVSLAWENPWTNISANVIAASSRWPNDEHYKGTMLDGYNTFGVTLYRNIKINKRNNINLRFDIKNLFDKQYEIVGNYPMPGRSWQFTVRYHY